MLMEFGQNARRFARMMLEGKPTAKATIRGDRAHWALHGSVSFYPTCSGVLVVAECFGLPVKGAGILGFHIHQGGRCSGDAADPFADTGAHYNPEERAHPYHAGDMPPLFANKGYAYQAFYTDRFRVEDILGKTVVIHSGPDDFTSQPAGNAGSKIACGIIRKND